MASAICEPIQLLPRRHSGGYATSLCEAKQLLKILPLAMLFKVHQLVNAPPPGQHGGTHTAGGPGGVGGGG